MKRTIIIFLSLVLGVIGYATGALAAETAKADIASSALPEISLADGQVVVSHQGTVSKLALPQPARAIYLDKGVLYVALGASGVSAYRVSTDGVTFMHSIPAERGQAVGFFISNGQVWVELQQTSATMLSDAGTEGTIQENAMDAVPLSTTGPPRAPVAPSNDTISGATPAVVPGTNEPPKKKSELEIKDELLAKRKEPIVVEEVYPGEVKLNVGTSDGIKQKDRFELYREISLHGGSEEFVGREMVAMVEVTAVNEKSCIAKLPRGDRALVGDTAVYVRKAIGRRNVLAQKFSRIGELSLVFRPILNLSGRSGGGTLFDGDLVWYGKHTFAAFRINPMAVGGTKDGSIFNGLLLAEGGYDGRAFAVGLGVGVGLTNGRMNATFYDSWYGDPTTSANDGDAQHAAFALSQFIRFGPLDGLNLTVHNSFILAGTSSGNDDDEGFEYGSTSAKVTIPTGYRLSLFFAGGGSRLGHGYGEVGVFAWLRGNGDAGSIGVSGALGGAGAFVHGQSLDESGYAETNTIAGPMVSFGLNYRFGQKEK